MDGRESMGFSGSSSYYMQRGVAGSGPGIQSGIHGPPGIRPLSSLSIPVQANIGGRSVGSTFPVESSSANLPHGGNVGVPSGMPPGEPVRRKRGRPRKYGPDGTAALALSPLSSSPPGSLTPTQKRGRGRPPGSGTKQQLASLGEWLSGSAGMGFTPHIITIAIEEDIATKIMSFSQQGPRAVCILSANGAVSTVTLRQPATSGGTVTYEVQAYDNLFLLAEKCLSCDALSSLSIRTGGLSVSLSSPDGRVIGGGVEGMLIAASPVQTNVCNLSFSRYESSMLSQNVVVTLLAIVVVLLRAFNRKQPFSCFVCGDSKTKNKTGAGPESGGNSDLQIGDKSVTPSSVPPNQNVTPPSSMSGWSGSRPLDMRNANIDIDLTRG
ncbi:hypothetical protein HHK36_000221 [Tetracentron sinense]|uniref:AT-hook motif nuclear-localized protein n=1 Tax=Tetracentron sinense TaxID=13715 RepID=A0A834ZV41_TETSI|nr:hypothetical protein HHK36_000221 [Tetracentron sinense]